MKITIQGEPTSIDAATKLNQRRKSALYMTMYGGAYGYHLLWLLSNELGVKIPPIAQSSTKSAIHRGRGEKCSVCEYFDADEQGVLGNCTIGDRTHEDSYCFSFERRAK